jgi:putative tricarboxylic transport membrane protein
MQPEKAPETSVPLVSTKAMEIAVAAILIAVSAVVVLGAYQVGAGWREDGPGPGFFPFIVGSLMGIASVINMAAAFRPAEEADSFVTIREFGRVLAVLIPATIYVALIGGIEVGPLAAIGLPHVSLPGLGLYVASALFIFGFMIAVGREPVWRSALVSVFVPVAAFVMFERWFRVALPKGPLEAMLGLG